VNAPLPPDDPALGPFRLALDGDAMCELLQRHVRWGVVDWCRPRYIKYKPGVRSYVMYDLSISGSVKRAFAAMYTRGRADKMWSRASQRTGADLGGATATLIPELDAIVHFYPEDPKLPGLRVAASARRMSELLKERVRLIQLVRYKPARRAVLRYEVESSAREVVYGKIRADDGGALLAELEPSLRRAGISTPALISYQPELRMTVFDNSPGTPLRELRGTRAYNAWMRPVAKTLGRLHSVSISCLGPQAVASEANDLALAVHSIGTLVPSIANAAEHLGDRVIAGMAGAPRRVATLHGSWHDDQVLVSERGVTLLDLDSACMGDPAVDVGHFLAYLSVGGLDEARSLFLDAYSSFARRPDGVFLFEAAALLRWATLPFRRLDPDWPSAIERHVDLAVARMSAHERNLSVVDGT
jgi:Phosphotransferase enzyme family